MKKNILVVDDEPDIRNSLKFLLEANGYVITCAENGNECLKKVKKTKFDLILLDIMMPGISVKEVIKKITDINIIFVSVVRLSENEKELVTNNNILGYIQKPFDINDVLKKVKKATSLK